MSCSWADHDVVRPDGDVPRPGQRRELRDHPATVWGSISAGGLAGALARYGLSEAFPSAPGGWPWTTWGINVSGCLLIGVLMVLISERWTGQRLLRPFLGIGVLGGFTTFSTAMHDVQQLVAIGSAGLGLAYLAGTVTAALAAVVTGSMLTRWALGVTRRSCG